MLAWIEANNANYKVAIAWKTKQTHLKWRPCRVWVIGTNLSHCHKTHKTPFWWNTCKEASIHPQVTSLLPSPKETILLTASLPVHNARAHSCAERHSHLLKFTLTWPLSAQFHSVLSECTACFLTRWKSKHGVGSYRCTAIRPITQNLSEGNASEEDKGNMAIPDTSWVPRAPLFRRAFMVIAGFSLSTIWTDSGHCSYHTGVITLQLTGSVGLLCTASCLRICVFVGVTVLEQL